MCAFCKSEDYVAKLCPGDSVTLAFKHVFFYMSHNSIITLLEVFVLKLTLPFGKTSPSQFQ